MNSGFIFYGFIPKKTNERSKILQEINENKFASIIYESPKRVEKLLNDFKKYLKDLNIYFLIYN